MIFLVLLLLLAIAGLLVWAIAELALIRRVLYALARGLNVSVPTV